MALTTQLLTAAELAGMPDDGKRLELVKGELRVMSPAGFRHGRTAMRLGALLDHHVRSHQLGVVCAAETGFLLSRDPDTVRASDVAFVRQARLEKDDEPDGYLPFAPDLAAEVVSPRDSFTQVEEKALFWLQSGTSIVLVVDPDSRSIHVYRDVNRIFVLGEDDTLDVSDVVPGFRISARELFE